MVKPSFVTNHLKRVHTGEMLYNVKKKKKVRKLSVIPSPK